MNDNPVSPSTDGAPFPDHRATPVPAGVEPPPPDLVCDLALDELRRLREGPSSPRLLAWDAADGSFSSYGGALAAWRRREFRAAIEWWVSRSANRQR